MANKIIVTLDPGHAKDYNRGVIKTYYESNAVYEASLKLKNYLNKYKIFDVRTTKPVLDCCPSLAERGKMAIQNKSRVFISLHSNAAAASAHYTVIFSSVKRKQNNKFENEVAQAITDIMKSYDGVSTNNGVLHKAQSNGSDYYGVLRSAVASDCIQYVFLIEHAFHTNTKSCKALLNEQCWEDMMEKLAELLYEETKKYYVGDNVPTFKGTTTDALNVRSDPSTDAIKLGLISKGGEVEIVSKTGTWYKILYNGCAAYVSTEYVRTLFTIPDDSTVDMGLPTVEDSVIPPDSGIEDSDTADKFLSEYGIDPNQTLDDANIGKVNVSDGVNVRTGPDTSYDKITAIPQGTLVGVYDVNTSSAKKEIGNWLYITTNASDPNATKGFVCKDYIDMLIVTTKKAVVNEKKGLNYRTGPGTNFPKVGALAYGAYVYTLGRDSIESDWMKIRLSVDDENIYYVSAQYLTEMTENATDNSQAAQTAFVKAIANCSYIRVQPNTQIRSIPESKGVVFYTTGSEPEIFCCPSTVNGEQWAKIVIGLTYGYVNMDYADIIVKEDTEYEEELDNDIAELIDQIPELGVSEWFTETLGAMITSDYGERIHPITGKASFHKGIDYGAPANTPIRTMVDGIITRNRYDSSYGNYVYLMDEQGKIHIFAHMAKPGNIPEGEFVIAGQQIGVVGTTGDSTGNHLHYEVRIAPWNSDNTINPESLSFQ